MPNFIGFIDLFNVPCYCFSHTPSVKLPEQITNCFWANLMVLCFEKSHPVQLQWSVITDVFIY